MKKLLSVLCVILILGTFAVTALAEDGNTAPTGNPRIIRALQNRSDRLAERIEVLKFKQTLLEKGETVRQNRKTNLELKTENVQLVKDIVDILLNIKQQGGIISQDMKSQLKAYYQQIREIGTTLKETRGDIRDIIASNRQNIKDMNYEAVEAAYNEIIAIQQNRAEQLGEINNILKDMKALLSSIE